MTNRHLDDKEKTTIEVLSADGQSPGRIARQVGRSPHTVKKHLEQPDVQQKVESEKEVLAAKYREQAHRILDSISDEDILKASLQQKSISSGVLLDKSLLLTGDAPSINVHVLLELVTAFKKQRDQEDQPQLPAAPER